MYQQKGKRRDQAKEYMNNVLGNTATLWKRNRRDSIQAVFDGYKITRNDYIRTKREEHVR